ncbi:hypothetical protein [Pseudomonas sp. PSKL.D1]|uniref:hypothetical protein n=1 Tax=Pseudomonas sp. PSKL.D1 TaxID=3029060 RepID=UPI002380DAFD|nr:hypothetical protein [Pseudomonas sp. PSKL.D1]WDY56686.1 hypothetical protein PVV54_19155 [Pseudomonas sp. PSKL.D1]
MKKIVPDPPHLFELPTGKSLSNAISEGIVPMEHVLANAAHYLMFAYSDCRAALHHLNEESAPETLMSGLRAIQIAWGQVDALEMAVQRTTELQ